MRISGLTFAYGVASEPVIRGLSLMLKEGEHLAVVGPSGIGKSMLARLLAGIQAGQCGEVTFGGVALHLIPEPVLRTGQARHGGHVTGAVRRLLVREVPGVPRLGWATVDVRDLAVARGSTLPVRIALSSVGRRETVSADKAKRELGWTMRRVGEILLDTARSLIDRHLVSA